MNRIENMMIKRWTITCFLSTCELGILRTRQTRGREWERRIRWRLVSSKIIMILLCLINSYRLSKLNWVTSTPRNPSLFAAAKQKMSEERVETLRLAVKHALKRSHNDNGLVFGDLRPPNVMITKDGSQYMQAITTTHVSAPDSFLVGTIHTHLYNWCQQDQWPNLKSHRDLGNEKDERSWQELLIGNLNMGLCRVFLRVCKHCYNDCVIYSG